MTLHQNRLQQYDIGLPVYVESSVWEDIDSLSANLDLPRYLIIYAVGEVLGEQEFAEFKDYQVSKGKTDLGFMSEKYLSTFMELAGYYNQSQAIDVLVAIGNNVAGRWDEFKMSNLYLSQYTTKDPEMIEKVSEGVKEIIADYLADIQSKLRDFDAFSDDFKKEYLGRFRLPTKNLATPQSFTIYLPGKSVEEVEEIDIAEIGSFTLSSDPVARQKMRNLIISLIDSDAIQVEVEYSYGVSQEINWNEFLEDCYALFNDPDAGDTNARAKALYQLFISRGIEDPAKIKEVGRLLKNCLTACKVNMDTTTTEYTYDAVSNLANIVVNDFHFIFDRLSRQLR